MIVERDGSACANRRDVTIIVASVSNCAAPAVAGNLLHDVGVGGGEAVGFLHTGGSGAHFSRHIGHGGHRIGRFGHLALTGTGRKSGKNQAYKEKGKYQSAHGYPLEKVFLLAHHNGEGLWNTAQIGGILISKIAYRRIQKAGAERSGCQMDDPYFRP